jgi:FAD/FMN-containing dehydrogenase
VSRLEDSFREIPPSSPIRLAKRTSNLFRSRTRASGPALDVSGLSSVISIDASNRTADVQGMCTYEHLVAATLSEGLMPRVVPQLKTITLGGAVTGLGIESTSFRNGLPHESVRELDILTGSGRIVTATPDNDHAELFAAFPNSYGTLGYAVRARIELEPVRPYVSLRNVRFADLDSLVQAIEDIIRTRSWRGDRVDFLDGVMFSPRESFLVIGSWAEEAASTSDYTGTQVYYRSLRQRETDILTVHDYLWRWDTDWFWCSAAFGAQNPVLRRIWPARWRRSDVYHRLVALETRYAVAARFGRWRGRPMTERVVQDVELPVERTAEYLRWFDERVGIRPVWLCPLRLRAEEPDGPPDPTPVTDGADPITTWPLYPLLSGRTYVNVGFWGTVSIGSETAEGTVNRRIEQAVKHMGGHKSLYSEAFYGPEEFAQLYGGAVYDRVRRRYDPDGHLLDLFSKVVQRR